MNWFCKHEFAHVENVVAPPVTNIESMRGASWHEAQRILQGTTSVVMGCAKCGKQKVSTYYGTPEGWGEK